MPRNFVPIAVLALVAGGVAQLRLPRSTAPEGRQLGWLGQLTARSVSPPDRRPPVFIDGVTALANPIVGRLLARWPPIALLAFGLALGALAIFLLTGVRGRHRVRWSRLASGRARRRRRLHAASRHRGGRLVARALRRPVIPGMSAIPARSAPAHD